jgi:hypothetical protein
MGIALFFAAASNLHGELKVDLVVPSTRTCVHLHPGCIGNLIAVFQESETFVFGKETRCGSEGAEDCIEVQNAGTGLVARCDGVCLGY